MPKMYYQGHGSFRLTADDGRVVYVDPFDGDGYDKPADIILVTHQHDDHNQIDLCAKKPLCTIISNEEAVVDGKHMSFDIKGIRIQSVSAYNENHNPAECVGYIIMIDGVKIYASGDTSTTEQMSKFSDLEIDYAVFCGDGVYNMDAKEAAECARLIRAKHNILIHIGPGDLFNKEVIDGWEAPNKVVVLPGEEISL